MRDAPQPYPAYIEENGFTLVELIVALSIVSLISLIMLGGLQFSTAAWRKLSSTNDFNETLLTTQSSMRRLIKQAVPMITEDDIVNFQGSPSQLQFIVTNMAKLNGEGLNVIQYGMNQQENYRNLHLKWRSYRYGPHKNQEFEVVELLRHVENIEFKYFGISGTGSNIAKWHSHWKSQATLPKLVKLKVSFPGNDNRTWPELYISLELAEK